MKRYIVRLYHEFAGTCLWLEVASFETEQEAFDWMFAQPNSAQMNVFYK